MGKKVIFTSIVLVCIILLIYLFVPAVAIWGESLLVRCAIHNPYVNRNFRGWSRVQIEELGAFLLPKGWSLEVDSEVYWIIDDAGRKWACGAIFGTEDSPFSNYQDLISTIQDTPCREIEMDPFVRCPMMNGSDIDFIKVYGSSSNSNIFCIQMLVDTEIEIVWMLLPDLSIDDAAYGIAEAIVYSFAFDVKRTRW